MTTKIEIPWKEIAEEFTDKDYDWQGPETAVAEVETDDNGKVKSISFDDDDALIGEVWFSDEWLGWEADD